MNISLNNLNRFIETEKCKEVLPKSSSYRKIYTPVWSESVSGFA